MRLFLAAVLMLAATGPVAPVSAHLEMAVTIPTTLGDTTETFWLQIPDGYRPGQASPLLIGWHQMGGDEWDMRRASDFDSIANARVWIAAAPLGSSRANWTNHATQSHVVDVIRWIEERYDVDESRIYMVGASMGGAAGMVFSNNHLDPEGPMIAAAASISGIQDCERRFHEQGINHSMIAAFGGTPEEVPFTYRRNSAIYFADSTQSMHVNASHLPLFLTFGSGQSDSIWRAHAEDLRAVMAGCADTVVIRESEFAGHGWECAEAGRICDFLEGFQADRAPARISVNADEEGRWYWATISMRKPDAFARFEGEADAAGRRVRFTMLRNVRSSRLDLAPLGFPLDGDRFDCDWNVAEGGSAELAFAGVPRRPSAVTRDDLPYAQWAWDDAARVLTIGGDGDHRYAILFDPAGVPGEPGSEAPLKCWFAGGDAVRYRLPATGDLRFALHDPIGRRVRSGSVRSREEGEIPLLRGLPSGVYFLEMRLGDRVPVVRKLAVTR